MATGAPTTQGLAAGVEAEPALTPAQRHRLHSLVRSPALPLVVAGIALFLLARAFQEAGHSWGDDFALYVNQARGLTDGTAGDVVADTRFAIDSSSYRSFSPEAYPWGFPLLLAGVMILTDVFDYSALKLVPTLSFVGAVLVLYLLLAARLPRWLAVATCAVFGLNSWYLSRTDQVLSDLTFWFLVLLALYVLDRAVQRDTLLVRYGPLGAALWALAAFEVRREGALILVAIAAAQLAAVVARRRAKPSAPFDWRAVVIPYAASIGGAVALQVIRPATILNDPDDVGASGLQHLGSNLEWYWRSLGELLGLRDVNTGGAVELFGSQLAATVLLTAILVLAGVGVVVALLRDTRRDLHLIVAFIAIAGAVLIQPFHEGRYLITLAPLLLYFAVRGCRAIATTFRPPGRRSASIAIPLLVVVPLLANTIADTRRDLVRHVERDAAWWGPEAAAAQELFAAVRKHTDPDEVVVFNQSRTMNLYTGRLTLQSLSVPVMLEGDWFAMTRDSTYIQPLLTDEEAAELGLERVWENETFVLWKIA